MIHHKDLSYNPKFIVYMKVWWIFHKQFIACDDVFYHPEDDIILCRINNETVAILDKQLFKFAKRINYAERV